MGTNDTKPILNQADSEMLGVQITVITGMLQGIDWEYYHELEKALHGKAEMYDSAAVLNRNWKEHKGRWMQEQANAMTLLRQYREKLMLCSTIKVQVEGSAAQIEAISKMFE